MCSETMCLPRSETLSTKNKLVDFQKGYTRAFYFFTADTAKEVNYQLEEERRKAYIKMFDDLT